RTSELMGVVKRLRRIADHLRCVRRREWLLSLHPTPLDRREVLARDVLHRDEVVVGLATEVVDLDDVRVAQLRASPSLVEEHFDEGLLLTEMREDLLDDDEAREPGKPALARKPDLGHAAGRDLLDQDVATEATWTRLIGRARARICPVYHSPDRFQKRSGIL